MKVYVDTSVINVKLFGEYSKIETERYPSVIDIFNRINSGQIQAIISLHAFQEIYVFCKSNFPPDQAGQISRLAFLSLCQNTFDLIGLLTREERLLHRRKFDLPDRSDQPHAISEKRDAAF